jgi:C4-dicarboxylate-binding protein DctP
MRWRSGYLITLAAVLLAFPATALAQQKILRYAHFQPARPDQPKHAAALAFKEHVERATGGSIKVEIFPAGQFGNDADTMGIWPWPTTVPSP